MKGCTSDKKEITTEQKIDYIWRFVIGLQKIFEEAFESAKYIGYDNDGIGLRKCKKCGKEYNVHRTQCVSKQMGKFVERELKKNCNSCKHAMFADCDELKNNAEFQKVYEISSKSILATDAFKWKENHVCDNYYCMYIQYPIEVSAIERDLEYITLGAKRIGKFVKIKPCKEDKTFLGLFLGELPIGITILHSSKTKILEVGYDSNPAIFVFDLNKIVYGMESWWGVIENESDLQEITDIDIENAWYVKALTSLTS